jgi:hypothetical protein
VVVAAKPFEDLGLAWFTDKGKQGVVEMWAFAENTENIFFHVATQVRKVAILL